jgi:hypothetical protein
LRRSQARLHAAHLLPELFVRVDGFVGWELVVVAAAEQLGTARMYLGFDFDFVFVPVVLMPSCSHEG